MKNTFILVLLGLSLMSFAQDELLPAKVEMAFKQKFPNVSLDYWHVKDAHYFLEHEHNSGAFTAVFDQNGEWIETAEIISDFDIPQNLAEFIEAQFPLGEISYCEKVQNPNTAESYRVNLYDDAYIIITTDKEGNNAKITREEVEE